MFWIFLERRHSNELFVLTDGSTLAVGGGGGGAAIMLDDELDAGTSAPCATFDSPCLASADCFRCVSVELWGFAVSEPGADPRA